MLSVNVTIVEKSESTGEFCSTHRESTQRVSLANDLCRFLEEEALRKGVPVSDVVAKILAAAMCAQA